VKKETTMISRKALAKVKARARADAKAKANARVVAMEDKRITRIALRHLEVTRPQLEKVFLVFAKHLRRAYAKELKSLKFNIGDDEIGKWFAKYAKKHPELATTN
jgi:hypothetical protein